MVNHGEFWSLGYLFFLFAALFFTLFAGLVLYLAIRSGQFKDPEGIARRMLDME